jgi:hypothetical protein
MTDTWLWLTVGAAVLVIVATKLAGHFLPASWVASPKVAPIVALISVALLAGLVVTQSVATGHRLVVDARLAALAVAAIALWRRAPFIVVVLLAAVTAGVLRWLGWG